jgi:carbon-monoxide dehydrogenase large subunit
MPRADQIPLMVLAHHSVPCTTHPLGVKGAGESGVAGAWPAAVSALLDALRPAGVKQMDLPFTANRIWLALKAAKAQSTV